MTTKGSPPGQPRGADVETGGDQRSTLSTVPQATLIHYCPDCGSGRHYRCGDEDQAAGTVVDYDWSAIFVMRGGSVQLTDLRTARRRAA